MSHASHLYCDSAVDYPTTDDQYFNDLVHWDRGYVGIDRSPYAGEGRQQLPTPQGWVPDITTPNTWPAEPTIVDLSQAGLSETEYGSSASSPSASSPPYSPEPTTISVSTAFNANTTPSPDHPPNFEIMSADGVLFSVSSVVLASTTCNGFGFAFPEEGVQLRNSEPADVLNLVLHAAYGASVAAFSPSLDTIAAAIGRLGMYGMDPQTLVAPGAPLFEALRSYAVLTPLRVYVLAAQHNLHGLAQLASAHLLAYPLHAMSDADAQAMGALYMKKLLVLQHNRVSQLEALLEQSQKFHPQTAKCGFPPQRKLAREWTRMASHVTANGRTDASSAVLRERLSVLKNETSCVDCKTKLDERIWKAVVGWAMLSTMIV
ncbi:hypothetical protein BD626DRAFT_422117 [Schizophyllum amplum]|uniref:BTB domain-containing protein n=1 Tax=Schizophyllum amplum TaxID=97359 RepID=A0A550CY50_9AGAR|nr:hypothetical protein BD626DRAFT_422117 [Auriculariopsis ampla]